VLSFGGLTPFIETFDTASLDVINGLVDIVRHQISAFVVLVTLAMRTG